MRDRFSTINQLIIRRRAKRKGFSISHRPFRSYGELNRELWWFGDRDFRLVSPEEGFNHKGAVTWLECGGVQNLVIGCI